MVARASRARTRGPARGRVVILALAFAACVARCEVRATVRSIDALGDG
jgi:hypothetical protein